GAGPSVAAGAATTWGSPAGPGGGRGTSEAPSGHHNVHARCVEREARATKPAYDALRTALAAEVPVPPEHRQRERRHQPALLRRHVFTPRFVRGDGDGGGVFAGGETGRVARDGVVGRDAQLVLLEEHGAPAVGVDADQQPLQERL